MGVTEFSLANSAGKALHFVATADIADLASYSFNLYSNGGTSPQNKILPTGSATSGDHILIVNDIAAMDTYIDASNIFDVVLVGTGLFFNGNDAIEIVFDGNVIETFGVVGDNPDTNGAGCSTPECWDHEDSWALSRKWCMVLWCSKLYRWHFDHLG